MANLEAFSPTMFWCISYLEEIDGTPITVANDEVCKGFKIKILPNFFRAPKDETKYAVKFGNTPLNTQNFRQSFDVSFLAEWAAKQKIYETAPHDCLICANQIVTIAEDGSAKTKFCNAFLGRKSKATEPFVLCRCCVPSVTKCSDIFDVSQGHECRVESLMDDLFGDLDRGVDYQICPHCTTKVDFWNGCNEAISPPARPTWVSYVEICFMLTRDISAQAKPCPRSERVAMSERFTTKNTPPTAAEAPRPDFLNAMFQEMLPGAAPKP